MLNEIMNRRYLGNEIQGAEPVQTTQPTYILTD